MAVEDRIERLEEWRVRAEVRSGRLLEQVATIARGVEQVAGVVKTHGDELLEQRARRAERHRLRAFLYSAATLAVGAAGFLLGVR